MQEAHKNWKLYVIMLIAGVGISMIVGYVYVKYSAYQMMKSEGKVALVEPTGIPGADIPLVQDAISSIPLIEEQSLAEPANAGLLRQQARNYIMISDLKKAASTFEQESLVNPNDPTLYKEMGDVYSQLRESEKAVASYTKSIEINPADNNSYIELANIYSVQLPDREKVIFTYEDAIKNNPNNVTFYILLASFYERIELSQKALDLYRRVVSIDPANSIATRKIEELSQ